MRLRKTSTGTLRLCPMVAAGVTCGSDAAGPLEPLLSTRRSFSACRPAQPPRHLAATCMYAAAFAVATGLGFSCRRC